MNEFAERIERDFPVRRKEKEKVDFRTWLVYTLKELGYSPKLESGTSALSAGGNVTNVVVGDIEKAKIVLAAHYDTGVREVLPPLICPTRPATYMLYEALMPLLALAVSFLISFGVTFALNMPNMTLPLFLLLLVVGLFYPKYGKSEMNNKNANTSGVIALLEVAKALTPRYRGEVCFLFLDGGTQGSKGAKRLIHAHPLRLDRGPVLRAGPRQAAKGGPPLRGGPGASLGLAGGAIRLPVNAKRDGKLRAPIPFFFSCGLSPKSDRLWRGSPPARGGTSRCFSAR